MRTFSIVITQANSLLAQVHNTRQRMPVILRKEHESRWLDADVDDAEIRSMLQSYDAHDMQAYAVAKAVSKFGLNTVDPDVAVERHYPELPVLSTG